MTLFIYQLKIIIKNKGMVFWTILFPLILASLFNLAFSNLLSDESFDIVSIAIVEENPNESFHSLIDSLSKEDENQLLKTTFVSQEKAKNLLEDESISAYLIVNNETIDIVVNNTGINETIIESIVNNYYQVSSAYQHIYELNPEFFINTTTDSIYESINYLKETSKDNFDLTAIYFYTLIGMTCMYGGSYGIELTNNIEANLSRKGSRINVSPTSKFKLLLTGLIASFLCQLLGVFTLLFYLNIILKISFGNQNHYILLLMFVGSFVGIAYGTLIGTVLKTKLSTKNGIMTALSMLFSFLSGMMIIEMKYIIAYYAPILAYINPVSLITDALYSLYYYDTYQRYFTNLMCLTIIGLVFIMISLYMMRRKKYDSI